LSAAKQFQKIGDDANLLEAAGCYEDAYKAFQQVKQTGMRFIEYRIPRYGVFRVFFLIRHCKL